MQVTRRLKAHALTAEQVEEAFAFRAVPMRLDRREAGRGRDFAREPRDDGGVSGVALPGQRERAIKVGFDMRGLREKPLFVQPDGETRSEEHTSEIQSLMRHSYAVFCLNNQKIKST